MSETARQIVMRLRQAPLLLLAVVLASCVLSAAQETVFNVPNADILERGKVYAELDSFIRPSEPSSVIAPRLVVGTGKSVEIGVNFAGLGIPDVGSFVLSPAAKWRFYNSNESGLALLVGENLSIPVRDRRYDLGSYTYLQAAKRWGDKTRLGAGAYYFSANVVDRAQRAGAQLSFERKISSTVTLAADWLSGRHANGYFTPGIVWSTTKKLTTYAAYQVGNAPSGGNHGLLIEFGYNF